MIVVGNFSGFGEISFHKDNDDYINAIVSIGGSDVIGGNTVYYSGINMKNIGKNYIPSHLNMAGFRRLF